MLRIFIADKEVELSNDEQIMLNYSSVQVDTPTAEKNTFSKTIEIQGTPTNNKIFGDIWRLDRTIVEGDGIGVKFDARKRVDCVIYNNNDIVENGYIQLNEITILNHKITYRITFYGGLGDFFYSLMYNERGEQLTLADLHYGFADESGNPFEDEDNDLLLTWDKNYLQSAWSKLKTHNDNDRRISNWVVPAPTYSGLYDDFDTKKVLIDLRSGRTDLDSEYFPFSIDEGEKYYIGYDGRWGLVETAREMEEWEVRNLNTRHQRPAVKLSLILNAISDPKNNGGYKVLWNDDINDSATDLGAYFQKSYMLLDRMDFEQSDGIGTTPVTVDSSGLGQNVVDALTHSMVFDTTKMTTPKISLIVQAQIDYMIAHLGMNGGYPTEIFTNYSMSNDTKTYLTRPCLRLVVKDNIKGTTTNSPIYVISSYDDYRYANPIGASKYIKDAFGVTGGDSQLVYKDVKFDKYATSFMYNADWVTYSHEGIKVEADLPISSNVTIKVEWKLVGCYVNGRESFATDFPLFAYKDNDGKWQQRVSTSQHYGLDNDADLGTNYIYEGNVAPSIQETYVNKQVLFGNTETPYDYLTSFTKMMGLKYMCDSAEKTIRIVKRDDYYINSVTDLTGKLDLSQQVRIQPCLSEYKWYKWGVETPETYASYLYGLKNKADYGTLMYDTGYYFNKEENEMFKDNVYQNIIPYRLNSVYFNNVPNLGSPAYTKTFTYTLWEGHRVGDLRADMTKPLERVRYGYGALGSLKKVYDKIPKLCCFSKENSNVNDIKSALCFFDGFTPCYPTVVNDNLQAMFDVVDSPCYIYGSRTDADDYDIVNEIPRFSKYLTGDNGTYISSYDFVRPNQTFLDDADNYGNGITLMKFWEKYIDDIFDKDSKQVDLYVVLDREPKEALRRFYYFDGAIWSLTEVEDYKPRYKKPLKCSFVKVKDIANYTSNDGVSDPLYAKYFNPNEEVRTRVKATGSQRAVNDERFTDKEYHFAIDPNTTPVDFRYEASEYVVGVWSEAINPCAQKTIMTDVTCPDWITYRTRGVNRCDVNYEIVFSIAENRGKKRTGTVVLTQQETGKTIELSFVQYAHEFPPIPPVIPYDEIWYTTTDGNIVVPYDTGAFGGANILSNDYTDEGGVILFDKDLQVIGKDAFYKRPTLKTIIIPDSVTSIGISAFENCKSLTSVNIPNSVTSIGISAFASCSSLTSVEIPNSVTYIGGYTFQRCSSLTSVTIPNSVTSIGGYTFFGCTSLTRVNSEVDGVFNIPDSVTSIDDYAFQFCSSLTSVEIPDSVTSIGNSAFNNCRSLTSVEIPNSVTYIGGYTFFGCSSLTNVVIPDSVTNIDYKAFEYCESLKSITFKGTMAQWSNIEKGTDWNLRSPIGTIHCTDGDIFLPS